MQQGKERDERRKRERWRNRCGRYAVIRSSNRCQVILCQLLQCSRPMAADPVRRSLRESCGGLLQCNKVNSCLRVALLLGQEPPSAVILQALGKIKQAADHLQCHCVELVAMLLQCPADTLKSRS